MMLLPDSWRDAFRVFFSSAAVKQADPQEPTQTFNNTNYDATDERDADGKPAAPDSAPSFNHGASPSQDEEVSEEYRLDDSDSHESSFSLFPADDLPDLAANDVSSSTSYDLYPLAPAALESSSSAESVGIEPITPRLQQPTVVYDLAAAFAAATAASTADTGADDDDSLLYGQEPGDDAAENRTVVLKNLPFGMTPESVHAILNQCSDIKPKRVVFLRNKNGRFKGTVLAKYANKDEAAEIHRLLNPSGGLVVDGRQIGVVFKSPKKRSKRSSKSQAQDDEKTAHLLGSDLMDSVGRHAVPPLPLSSMLQPVLPPGMLGPAPPLVPCDAPYPPVSAIEFMRRGSLPSPRSLDAMYSHGERAPDAPYPPPPGSASRRSVQASPSAPGGLRPAGFAAAPGSVGERRPSVDAGFPPANERPLYASGERRLSMDAAIGASGRTSPYAVALDREAQQQQRAQAAERAFERAFERAAPPPASSAPSAPGPAQQQGLYTRRVTVYPPAQQQQQQQPSPSFQPKPQQSSSSGGGMGPSFPSTSTSYPSAGPSAAAAPGASSASQHHQPPLQSYGYKPQAVRSAEFVPARQPVSPAALGSGRNVGVVGQPQQQQQQQRHHHQQQQHPMHHRLPPPQQPQQMRPAHPSPQLQQPAPHSVGFSRDYQVMRSAQPGAHDAYPSSRRETAAPRYQQAGGPPMMH